MVNLRERRLARRRACLAAGSGLLLLLAIPCSAAMIRGPRRVQFIRYDVSALKEPVMINNMMDLEPSIKDAGYPLLTNMLPVTLPAPAMMAVLARTDNILDNFRPIMIRWHQQQSAMEIDALLRTHTAKIAAGDKLSFSWLEVNRLEHEEKWRRMAISFKRFSIKEILQMFDDAAWTDRSSSYRPGTIR